MSHPIGPQLPPRPMAYPPQYPAPPQPQSSDVDQQKAGLLRAGKAAIWVWIALSLVPVVVIVGCLGLCLMGGLIGAVAPAPTPTP